MARSFWNRGYSIPVSDLSKFQLIRAIHEWAEGNRELEKLLWWCHRNGVLTSGCDAGDHHFPYIDFQVEGSSIQNLKRILVATENLDDEATIFLMFVSNPYSGPNWYKPTLAIFPSNKNFFKDINKSLKKTKIVENGFVNILQLHDFLKDKECGLDITFEKTSSSEYSLSFRSYMNERNWQYYTDLFCEAGLTKIAPSEKDSRVMEWNAKCSSKEDFDFLVNRIMEVLSTKWTLGLLNPTMDDMDFKSIALYMHRLFENHPKGDLIMKEWLRRQRKK